MESNYWFDANFIERVWGVVAKGEETECWPCTLKRHANSGYYLRIDAKSVSIHRIIWEIHNRQQAPKGRKIYHLCRNQICCNPSHLYVSYGPKFYKELTCRGCGATWQNNSQVITVYCPFCGKAKDARDRTGDPNYANNASKQRLAEWCKDREAIGHSALKSRELLRKRVFFRIQGSTDPKCVRCGCNDVRFLEVNHKNGGGTKELNKGKGSMKFYYDIALGRRSIDDLELLCKPCNAIHALELKHGSVSLRVIWNDEDI